MLGRTGGRGLAGTLIAAILIAAIAVSGVVALAASEGDSQRRGKRSPIREVLAVSNNWDGTVDLVDPHTFKRLKRINIVPDRAERELEVATNPDRLALFLAIRQQIGEGNDQLADDAFTSPDGRFIYVSRPSFADVVAINMKTGKIKWRVQVEGYRSDHMAISRNGRRVLVSDSTANKVFAIDTAKGEIVGSFPPGTRRTRTTSPRTASGSITPASAASTPRPTSPSSTPPRAPVTSRSSTPAT